MLINDNTSEVYLPLHLPLLWFSWNSECLAIDPLRFSFSFYFSGLGGGKQRGEGEGGFLGGGGAGGGVGG